MAKFIAVVSGKGGTGKSTVSACLSKALAELGCPTLAVDLDAGLRSLDLLMGMENRVVYDLGDAMTAKCRVLDAVAAHESQPGLGLLCGPSPMVREADLPRLYALLREASRPFMYTVLDLPAGLGLSVRLSQELADLVAVVAVPDIVAVRDARVMADAVLSAGRKSCRLIVNKVGKDTMRTGGLRDLDELMDTVGIQLFGVVPWDPYINSRSAARKEQCAPLTEKVFGAMAQRVTGKYVPILVKSV